MQKVFVQNGLIRPAMKSAEKVSDIQRNALTSLIHFVQLRTNVK